MGVRVHLFGGSGSGTTTLGQAIAAALAIPHRDTDDFYWYPTDPPFAHPREPGQRLQLLDEALAKSRSWVLSGSLCGWGDPLITGFTHAVFLHVEPAIREARLLTRERQRYGSRIDAGGDLFDHHNEFMEWARSYDKAGPPMRSRQLHESWQQGLSCPILRLDSSQPVPALIDQVLLFVESAVDGSDVTGDGTEAATGTG
ncbi:MAG: hypothetical protein AAF581_07870 [Planctomycetota bacterium]